MSRAPGPDRKLQAIFQAEAADHVQRMQAVLAQLEAVDAGDQHELVQQLFRSMHSLKGAARAVGEDEIETVCHASEGLLADLRRGDTRWTPQLADALHAVVMALDKALLRHAGRPGELAALLPRLEGLAAGVEWAMTAPPPTPAPAAAPVHDVPPPAGAEPEATVRVPERRLGRLLFQAEELVAARLQAQQHVAEIDEALVSATALRPPWHRADPVAAQAWRRHEAQLRALKTAAARQHRQLDAAVGALLDDLKQALLLPAKSSWPLLVATVRELARSQGKDAELRVHAEGIEMDRRLLEALREPLLHLVRNAVSHGIETPAQRAAAGKPARALIELAIEARGGGEVEITVTDDGAGIDTARLAQAARAADLAVPAEEGADLLALVFGAGVSTAESLTPVAGRGLGLAIVRDTVERLGGTVAVRTAKGQGTVFRIVVAASLATYRAVEVSVGGRSFLLPTARVERCVRAAPGQLRAVGTRHTIALGEQDLPLADLAALLQLPAGARAAGSLPCVVLEAGGRRVALAVEAIRGEQEVLGRPTDAAVTGSPVVAGTALLGAGQAATLLNASELVRMALRAEASGASALLQPAPGRAVLLAEDSLTSRTLLKNILELAGHRVDVAADGAEALDKLRAGGRYDVVVSDIEMPRLDGIALTQAIRAEPGLEQLPVVLVSSLATPADRARGTEAGANAYLVKSSFDPATLLQTVAELA